MRTYYRRAAVNGGEVFYREAPRSRVAPDSIGRVLQLAFRNE